MTSALLTSLKVWKSHSSGVQTAYKTGIPSGARGYKGVSINRYAFSLEYGSAYTGSWTTSSRSKGSVWYGRSKGQKKWSQPPRPVFGPALVDFKRSGLSNSVSNELLKKISIAWR
jgi:hypothetical protein